MRYKQAMRQLFHSIASMGRTFLRHVISVMDTHDLMRYSKKGMASYATVHMGSAQDEPLVSHKGTRIYLMLISMLTYDHSHMPSTSENAHKSVAITVPNRTSFQRGAKISTCAQ